MMPELIDMTIDEMHDACEALSQLLRLVPVNIQTIKETNE